MRRACGCSDTDTAEPRLLYIQRQGDRVRRRIRHDDCGTAWCQIETLEGDEIAVHVDA